MNMLPQIFAKTNKRGCPYIGVILISVSMFLFAYIDDSRYYALRRKTGIW